MSRTKPPVTPELIQQLATAPVERTRSCLEENYGQFYDSTIHAADRGSLQGGGKLMRDMNRIFTLCTGLGTVLRIVSGNPIMEDAFDPTDPCSEPPLSARAISSLTSMAAEMCEFMSDEISITAARFNDRGQA